MLEKCIYNPDLYEIPRDEYQFMFHDFLEACNFDIYGIYYGDFEDETDTNVTFENDEFLIRPFYWGDDDKIPYFPNFLYKPTGFELSWYKYSLRSAFCTQDVSLEDFGMMLYHCAASMGVIWIPKYEKYTVDQAIKELTDLKVELSWGNNPPYENLRTKEVIARDLERIIEKLEKTYTTYVV